MLFNCKISQKEADIVSCKRNRYERKVDVVINGLITGKFACYVKQKQTTEKPQGQCKISTS